MCPKIVRWCYPRLESSLLAKDRARLWLTLCLYESVLATLLRAWTNGKVVVSSNNDQLSGKFETVLVLVSAEWAEAKLAACLKQFCLKCRNVVIDALAYLS